MTATSILYCIFHLTKCVREEFSLQTVHCILHMGVFGLGGVNELISSYKVCPIQLMVTQNIKPIKFIDIKDELQVIELI